MIDRDYLKTPRIINAFRAIDRADFVLSEYKNQAYEDHPLLIGEGQTISQPLTVAFMLELLDPQPGEKILDIGTGSGWQTTLLAHVVTQPEDDSISFSREFALSLRSSAGRVAAIERIPELCKFARKNLEKYDYIKNGVVKFYCQDASLEIPDGPYDKIIAAAAASKNIPEIWRRNLKVGGKIVAPVDGSVWLFIKKTATEWEDKEFPGFSFVPLVKDERRKTKDKSHDFKNKFLIIALAFSLLAFSLTANEIYRPHTAFSNGKSIEIPVGLGSRKIADLLKKEGVIRSKWVFVVYVSLTGRASLLKPGSYVFFNSSTMPKIAADLVRGGVSEMEITIPEGWTAEDIALLLGQEMYTRTAGDFFRLVTLKPLIESGQLDLSWGKRLETFNFLKDKPEKASLEGYLFPDTYRVFVDAKAKDIILKMLENFGKKLDPDLRAEIARQQKTIFDVVTMASLIEKEVSSDEDRALVSGVLWKRLDLGMGLQVDATITYIKKIQNPKSKIQNKRISIEDTKIDNPYNTYKYRGLPPGPISNPGLSAIKAAIYPKESPYLYYLSTEDGKTIFSKTLEEHNLAKAKYLRKIY